MKLVTNTNLALSTSLFILISVMYSIIVNEPIYKFTSFLHTATMTLAIVTLGIHFNALKENEEKKNLLIASVVIPIVVLLYFAIGGTYGVINGN